jgi:hypothetical protein
LYTLRRVSNLGELCKTILKDVGGLGTHLHLRSVLGVWQWREWNEAGGVSADDFERFLDDRMRYRPTKRKRHLRLISTNKIRRLIVNRRHGGDDAA